MRYLLIILTLVLDVIPAGKTFLNQIQKRDSILVADQLRYGVRLDSVKAGTALALPDFSSISNDTLTLVGDWRLDTIKTGKRRRSDRNGLLTIDASVVISPFEPGKYSLPAIPVLLGKDTLLFEAQEMEVKTIPIDTTTFQIHDIKGQMTYPVTFREVAPWVAGALLLIALIVLAVILIRKRIAAKAGEMKKEPAYIIALRKLDKYRGDKFWAPDKQKAFYSGITDALKEYIDDRFSIDAPEMTTAELFAAIKSSDEITPELYSELKELFETADFVKFAKLTVGDEENARALPLAVRFVTSTYQAEVEAESASGNGGEAAAN